MCIVLKFHKNAFEAMVWLYEEVQCRCLFSYEILRIESQIFPGYMLSFAAEFVASPINEIPIIPTALAKNLSGPLRLTQVQGIPKFG